MATIRFSRPPETANSASRFDVYLDGSCVAQLANGQTIALQAPAGRHLVQIKAGSLGSRRKSIILKEGVTKTLVLETARQANSPEPFTAGAFLPDLLVNGLLLLYYFTIGHNRYLSITEPKAVFE